jgi:hypothetical protein
LAITGEDLSCDAALLSGVFGGSTGLPFMANITIRVTRPPTITIVNRANIFRAALSGRIRGFCDGDGRRALKAGSLGFTVAASLFSTTNDPHELQNLADGSVTP